MISKNIDKTTYEKLAERFKDVASWALWRRVGDTDTSNTGDMTIFSDIEELKKLNRQVVFVALNASVHAERADGYTGRWRMFHSDDNERQKDYRLRYQLVDTPFEGQYITDIIKNHPDKDSTAVQAHIKKHPEVVTENIKVFREELEILGGNPILIAIGGASEKILKDNLKDDYTILGVTHYSHYISKERLRERTINLLLNEKSLEGMISGDSERERLVEDRDSNKLIADDLDRLNKIKKEKKAKEKTEEELKI